MKDNKQNLTDLIGALAVDIEEIKKKLDAKDSPDKNEALKRLEAKLEPVIRFFNGNAPENVNAIFGSKEAIEEYKQSIGDEAVASLRLYTEANEKDMRKHGVLTIKEQLNKILERLTSHIENDKLASEKSRQKQSAISELWQAIRPDKAISCYGAKFPMAGTRTLTHGPVSVVCSYSLPCLPSVGYNGMSTGKKTGG